MSLTQSIQTHSLWTLLFSFAFFHVEQVASLNGFCNCCLATSLFNCWLQYALTASSLVVCNKPEKRATQTSGMVWSEVEWSGVEWSGVGQDPGPRLSSRPRERPRPRASRDSRRNGSRQAKGTAWANC